MSILGNRVMRTEDPAFLTRGAIYTGDGVDGQWGEAVHATFVRSPLAHARILGIDASEARAYPGVVAVLTSADLAGPDPQPHAMPFGYPAGPAPQPHPMPCGYPDGTAHPLLASEVVRYVGEAVAVVLTEDRYSGEDA